MIITEAELREAWRNGRGAIPVYPPGTRYTPAARDFLAAIAAAATAGGGPGSAAGGGPGSAAIGPAGPADAARGPAGRLLLRGEPGRRLILTADEIDDLVAQRPESVVVHPTATLTDAARERLRGAGVRILPWVETGAAGTGAARPAEPASCPPGALRAATAPAPPSTKPQPDEEELRLRIAAAVRARLGAGLDEALLDAVIRRVLATLG